jgi:hypothetical protein
MHYLYTGQLIDAAKHAQVDGADELIQVIQQTQSKLADLVAEHHGIAHGVTSFEMGEIGSGFGPKEKGQKCPCDFAVYDDSSNWVDDPEEVEPLKPMVVLFQSQLAEFVLPTPIAFRCNANDADHAENLCLSYESAPIEILWVTETDSVEVALDSYWRYDEPRPEVAKRGLAEPADNDSQNFPFDFLDQSDGPLDEATDYQPINGNVTAFPHGLSVRVNGYTDNASQDDMGELFLLIRQNGDLKLIVFADVNQEEPTHTISLETARNLNREILHAV